MRSNDEAIRRRLLSALEAGSAGIEVLAFAEAVVEQVGHPLGTERVASVQSDILARVVSILEAAVGGEASRNRAAEDLAREPALLAGFYQNLDLLPARSSAATDAVALLVLTSLACLEATPPLP